MLVDIIFYDKLCANKMNTAKYYNVEYVSTLTLQANLINTTATTLSLLYNSYTLVNYAT